MVKQHYRWDFVGLSTDTKPTPQTSEKVVDGSTFYCSDTSKLYVFCGSNWYERKSLGGGGGGTTYTAGDGIDITNNTISVDTTTIQPKLTAGSNVSISDNTISATDTTYSNFIGTDGITTGTSGLVPAPTITDINKFLKSDGTWATAGGGEVIKTLTSEDYNYPETPNGVSLGLLDEGFYQVADNSVYVYAPSRSNNLEKCLFFVFRADSNGVKRAICIRPDADASAGTHIVTIYGYNSTTGQSQSWETKNLADEYELSGIRTKTGSSAPTTSTRAEVGQFYLDTTNNKLYICVSAIGGVYTWKEVSIS